MKTAQFQSPDGSLDAMFVETFRNERNFGATLLITATRSVATWAMELSFPTNQTITEAFGAQLTRRGSTFVLFSDEPLPQEGKLSVGLLGTV
jgi:hypothetical protein